MKRLKFRHLFHGKFLPVFIPFFIVSMLIPLISFSLHSDFNISISCVIIIDISAIFLFLFIAYAIIHHLTEEEKQKIAEASPPEWKKITKKIENHFKENIKGLFIETGIIIVLEIIFSFIVLLKNSPDSMICTLVIIIPATIIVFLAIGIYEHIWANMDDSAIYTRIKIDHCFYGEKTRTGARSKFMVFYLPDGKYVLEITDTLTPKEIIVIKYKCFIRWENADILI